jgi:PAS domain S-box-containing protein
MQQTGSTNFSSHEQERLQALDKYEILDTLPEQDFDALTQLASYICGTPISLISLIDKNRQWFKSSLGMAERETSRSISFCQHAILQDDVYEVEDATQTDLYKDNPLVTGNPNIRFYAGAPLITSEGYKLGTVCVIDREPRVLTADQKNALQTIAREVVNQLELRYTTKLLTEQNIGLEQFQLLFTHSQVLMSIHDAATHQLIQVNHAFTKLLGYSRQELLGKKWHDLVYIKDREKAKDISEDVYSKRQDYIEFDTRFCSSTGEIYWLSCVAVQYEGKWFTNLRDITAKRKQTRELSSLKTLLSGVLDSSLSGISAFRSVRDKEGQIVDFEWLTLNKTAERIFGSKDNLLIGKHLIQEMPGNRIDGLFERYKDVVETGISQSFEHFYAHENLKTWFYTTIVKLEDGFTITFTDITERKEAELQLIEAKQNAERSMKAKEEFLSNMSHEIRTPLNAMIGVSHLLMQEAPRPDQMENLKILHFSAENLLHLVNDILDFNKIDAGKVVFEAIDFSLNGLVDGIRQSLTYKAKEKGLRLRVRMDTALPELVNGDPVRLAQVLNNLTSNALKFTETGHVTIDVSLNQETSDTIEVDFSITDTGIGIEPDMLESIFESFTQASTSTTRRFGGTGLGLAITKKLLDLQNGTIQVESQPGKGSTFSFSLVFGKSSAQAPAPQDQAILQNLKGVQILLVEDNDINQKIATKFLTKWGAELDYAVNGKEALQQVASAKYDIILMDLQMPEMDGYEATRCIRQMEDIYYKQVPIIALTASAMTDVKEKVFAIGMTDYISKPFNPKELQHKISQHIDFTKPHLIKLALQEHAHTLAATPYTGNIIDLSDLLSIAEDSPEFEKSLLTSYIRSFEQLQNDYQQVLQQGDYSRLKAILHKISPALLMLKARFVLAELERGLLLLTTPEVNQEEAIHSSIEQMNLCCAEIIVILSDRAG